MRMPSRFVTLALGSLLALAALSIPATQAYAKPRTPTDNGVRCAYYDRKTGSWEFYLPGSFLILEDENGNHHAFLCTDSGEWLRQGSGPDLQGPGEPVDTP